MAAIKNKLGRVPCDGCGHPTVLKENEHGTLTMGCDECDLSSFAKKNTTCAARWRSKLPALQVQEISEKDVRELEKMMLPVRTKKEAAPVPSGAPKAATPFSSLFGM